MGKSRKKREGRGERAPAIRAPIDSILQSLAAAKFRLVNQTMGGVGCHSMKSTCYIRKFYPLTPVADADLEVRGRGVACLLFFLPFFPNDKKKVCNVYF